MAKAIFYSLAALVHKILFCHSKVKFISSRQWNILYLFCYEDTKNTGVLISNSLKQKKLIFNFFVNRNWKKLIDSRKRAKILADNRKSHHPIETLKIEAMYERPRVNVRVERGSTFTFMRGLSSYIASILFFTRVKCTLVRTEKVRGGRNPPLVLKCWTWITQLWMAMYRRDMLNEKLQNCNGFFTTRLYPLF